MLISDHSFGVSMESSCGGSKPVVFFLIKGLIQWYDLCEKTPSTKSQTVVCFGDLAGAFRALHQHRREWTEDAVISVIDELMCTKTTFVCSYYYYYSWFSILQSHATSIN